MRAVVVKQVGGPEAFQFEQTADPVPGPDQVLVRLAVSGINFIDVYHRSGLYSMPLPFRAGVEGVGVVEADGAGFGTGQRVGWLAGGLGAFSELAVVAAPMLVPLPDDIDDVTATALLMQGVTAHYLATSTYPVQHGDTVLVQAAAGGVGLLLTQIAKLRGATVIGTCSTQAKAQAVREAGADHVLGYDDFAQAVADLTGGVGVVAAFDGVGAATFDGSLACLRPRGTLVSFGNASGPVPPFDILRLAGGGSLYVTRPTVVNYIAEPGELQRRTEELFGWARSGQVCVAPPTQFPIAQVHDAFAALESRATTGKVVLIH
ncbi:MAG: quinone oxidoreductase [Candidatus Nanopelagicales bacterium]